MATALLGTWILWLAFFLTCLVAIVSVIGARRESPSLVGAAREGFTALPALLGAASALLVHAFLTGNLGIRYVHAYSDAQQPLFFKLTAYWSGLDGSLLFWSFLLSVFGAIAVSRARESDRALLPYVVAVIATVECFFLLLMVAHRNPFAAFPADAIPPVGRGPNPLLQNPYMAIHPPSMYTGFVGMTIPFAFGIAALLTGQLDDSWLRDVRRWTLVSWLFLSLGLTLGMIWAYEELGWGGYWGWDPVENAGLLPWFTATAFLHSAMLQERRGMLKVWNVSLVITTFLLTIFGTFMTRSGIVQSVHAFGEDKTLAWMFVAFMTLVAAGSFGLVLRRLPRLRTRHELTSWASREAAFLANNWVLLFAAFFVLFATMFPTLSEAVTGDRLTVGPPFFNRWMLPIGLVLLALTGVGPLLAWRKSSITHLVTQFAAPGVAAIATGAAVWTAGLRVRSSVACFALSAFAAAAIAQEFWRGTRVRQAATDGDFLSALVGLVARSKRRYGGYVVHLGIVLMCLGFAGEGFKQDEQVLLKPGQQTEVGRFVVRYDGLSITDDGQKEMISAKTTLIEDGRLQADLLPARWYFRKHEDEPTTEVAIRRGFFEDVYLVLAGHDVATQSISLQVVVNPLVNWIWAGFALLAAGALLAILPDRAFVLALGHVPRAAATATLVLLLVGGSTAADGAQHVEPASSVVISARSPLERELDGAIVCMCGTCGRRRIGECTCSLAADMRAEVRTLVGQGLSRDQVLRRFVEKYGSQEPLAEPFDEGFNRAAWLMPYAIGASGLGLLIMLTLGWSRRGGRETPEARLERIDERSRERLHEELASLD